MATPRDIGVDVIAPEADWDGSENCPFYGSLRVRGQIIEGIVSSLGMNDSIVVERQRIRSMKKYARYEKKTNRFNAHLPSCVAHVSIGDRVIIMECRPLSKTISFCVIEREASE